ncbi:uncharacterized protein DDB_G0292186-like [Cydia splendana]|uniref:uncharacterized protein DDB_G0292186-like n=1 Tax=Cydia splendana TaxID=1100963 RepID=UPI00300CC590
MEYIEMDPTEDDHEEDVHEDSERGKRQIRYYLKNGFKTAVKNWPNSKPIKFIDLPPHASNQNIRHHQSSLNGLHKNNLYDASSKPYTAVNNIYSTANPFAYQNDNTQSQRPFKASPSDPFSQRLPYNPMNSATQIITKSPPISALKNSENPFAALAGGFYNNAPKQNNQNSNRYPAQSFYTNNQNSHNIVHDSSRLPSTVVTGKPVSTISPFNNAQRSPSQPIKGESNRPDANNRPNKQENYNDEDTSNENDDEESSEESSSENDDDDQKSHFKFEFPEPPYEFTHPRNKFADIENPFANPNFDFDAFLEKLRDEHYEAVGVTTPKPKVNQNAALITRPSERPTSVSGNSGIRSSTLNYQGMSTPRPFSSINLPSTSVDSSKINSNVPTTKQPEKSQQLNFRPLLHHQQTVRLNNDQTQDVQQSAGTPLDAALPKLKPPNFRDERILPINYNFNKPINSTQTPNLHHTQHKGETQQVYSITQRPYLLQTGSGAPILLSTPKLQYLIKQQKPVTGRPYFISTVKPYLVSSIKPHNAYLSFKQSTSKPLTTLANEQLAALQHYWNSPSTELYLHSTPRPTSFSNLPKLENLFVQTFRPSVQSPVNQNNAITIKDSIPTTTKQPEKRRPIPKPSPEMADYYYDDEDEQYYYEPPVKSIYMPSSEIKPQRPPMAQNYQEYDDSESYESDEDEPTVHITPQRPNYRQPSNYKTESATKNHNDVSVVTKAPHKERQKPKIPIPVMVDFVSPAPTVLMRPEVSNYEIVHHAPRNRTIHIRKPAHDNGPFTARPPKYLNQTTLRPYTVRHRLAKPTTVKETTQTEDNKQNRGRIRHHNLVAQTKMTTPRDNHNQETRLTKTRHDDKTNRYDRQHRTYT